MPELWRINFYPLADEVPGDQNGAERTTADTEHLFERLGSDEPS